MRSIAGLERHAKVNPARRRPNCPTRPRNALSRRSKLNMAAIVDHRLRGHRNRRAGRWVVTATRCANAKALREMGKDEAADVLDAPDLGAGGNADPKSGLDMQTSTKPVADERPIA